jgi:hypothetical protein
MAKQNKGDVVQRLKQLKAAVDRPGYNAARRADLTETITESLSTSTLDGLFNAALDLDSLTVVEGVKGVVDIWQGEPEGWTFLQTSFAYLSWQVRICTGLFQRGRIERGFDFASPQNNAARCLAHAIATREDDFADWCGRMMLANFTTGEGLYDRWFMPFEPFMVQLFARWKNLPIPPSALPCPRLGVYQKLLDAWNNQKDFAAAAVKACDYHAKHSIEEQIAYAEFVRIPHNVFPAEILAVRRVRNEEGLLWPAVEHALLKTPLVALPSSLPHVRNQLIDLVARNVRSLMPEVAPPQKKK